MPHASLRHLNDQPKKVFAFHHFRHHHQHSNNQRGVLSSALNVPRAEGFPTIGAFLSPLVFLHSTTTKRDLFWESFLNHLHFSIPKSATFRDWAHLSWAHLCRKHPLRGHTYLPLFLFLFPNTFISSKFSPIMYYNHHTFLRTSFLIATSTFL
jgi:hypothetical protein